jgi:glycosyltransferase involved in cell wall biosynthesis
VIVLGSVWEHLPALYNITTIYCTPSVMEGFGMTAQEAAACGRPVVASDLVPFVHEYLVGESAERIPLDGQALRFGRGGVVVPADFIDGFAHALVQLLQDQERRNRMGAEARGITIPYFTWGHMTKELFDDLGVSPRKGT